MTEMPARTLSRPSNVMEGSGKAQPLSGERSATAPLNAQSLQRMMLPALLGYSEQGREQAVGVGLELLRRKKKQARKRSAKLAESDVVA